MKTITQNDLDLHARWLRDEPDGVQIVVEMGANLRYADLSDANLRCANLRYADLSDANLRCANLRYADLRGANLRYANLRYADLSGANLSGADLRYADLSDADLRYADLRYADLDYSAWPLWCGSNHVKVDVRIAAQLAAHFCALDCDDPKYQAARAAVLEFAKTSHWAKDLGLKGGEE